MKKEFFCPNCNASLSEGTKICPECGEKVNLQDDIKEDTALNAASDEKVESQDTNEEKAAVDADAKTEAQNDDEQKMILCPNCGAAISSDSKFCPECGQAIHQETVVGEPSLDEKSEKDGVAPVKSKIKPFHIGIIVAMCLLAIFGFILLSGKSKVDSNIIYAKDGELQFMDLSNLSELDTFEMTSRLNNNSYDFSENDYVAFSEYILTSDDGRYIFYPDRVEDYDFSYYWRDLKADNTENNSSVKIDSDINGDPLLTGDGSKFFYTKDDDRLFYVYDRETDEKSKLDDEVYEFYVNEEGNYIVYSKFINDEFCIYEMTLTDMTGEKNKIDSNSLIESISIDEKSMYYTKDSFLYYKENEKEKVEIASDVYLFISAVADKSAYYIEEKDITKKISSFIDDDMADSDEILTEPLEPEIEEAPVYHDTDEFEYEVWYESYWGDDYNYATGEYGYWSTEIDYDAYNAAYDVYSDAFDVWKAEYTDIVNEYNDKYNEYNAKLLRDEFRLQLESEDNNLTYQEYSLYYWNNDVNTLVASNLSDEWNYGCYLAVSSENPILVYQKYSEFDVELQKMSDVFLELQNYYYIEDFINDMKDNLLYLRNTSEEVYVALGDKENILEADEPGDFEIDNQGTIYFIDNHDSEKYYGTFMSASTKDGVIEKPVKIDDDVVFFSAGNENENYYYFKDMEDFLGDLYLNGEFIASNVYPGSLFNYKGTDILVYETDFIEGTLDSTLRIYKDGTETEISDDVRSFVPVDENNVVFMMDYNQTKEKGDLMLYNGEEDVQLLDSDVTSILWNLNKKWWFSY